MRPRRPNQYCLQLDIAHWHTYIPKLSDHTGKIQINNFILDTWVLGNYNQHISCNVCDM